MEYIAASPSGRYVRGKEILGRGPFKTVYKAFDRLKGRDVAWKQIAVLDVSQNQMDAVKLELDALRSLEHDNIIKLYGWWIDDRKKNINVVTELFTSGSLRQYCRNRLKKDIDTGDVKSWARQILSGLNYLHGHAPKIIHRDLNCGNIFIDGSTGQVKIGDLGSAFELNQQVTAESYDDEYNESVDIYSFGMCILELVTGENPYANYKKGEPSALAKVADPQVKEFIKQCLVPASIRLTAAELLNGVFLVSETTTEGPNNGTCRRQPSIELEAFMDDTKFWLRGQQVDELTVSLTTRITYAEPRPAATANFAFYLDVDTTMFIAKKMEEELKWTYEEISVLTTLLEDMLRKLVPTWRWGPGSEQSRNNKYSDRSSTTSCDCGFCVDKCDVIESPIKPARSNVYRGWFLCGRGF